MDGWMGSMYVVGRGCIISKCIVVEMCPSWYVSRVRTDTFWLGSDLMRDNVTEYDSTYNVWHD